MCRYPTRLQTYSASHQFVRLSASSPKPVSWPRLPRTLLSCHLILFQSCPSFFKPLNGFFWMFTSGSTVLEVPVLVRYGFWHTKHFNSKALEHHRVQLTKLVDFFISTTALPNDCKYQLKHGKSICLLLASSYLSHEAAMTFLKSL